MSETNPSKPMAVHPAATLFPMMPPDELQKLADDIKDNGLRESIALYDGQVLDGRNRLKACEMAGVEPKFTDAELNGGSAILFVASKNLHRRHLTVPQRAAIGAEMLPMLREEARERQRQAGHEAGNGRPKKVLEGVPQAATSEPSGPAREIAAKAVGVCGKTVQSANTVREMSPELFEQMKRGEIGVEPALDQVLGRSRRHASAPSEPEKKTTRSGFPNPGTQRRAQFERAETERMVSGISRIRGLCRGLDEMKMELIRLSPEERRMWAGICGECVHHIRSFAKKVAS